MGGKINSIEELEQLADGDGCECYILLTGGLKSSKIIRKYGSKFHIIHEIDGSDEVVSNLADTNIGFAIQRGTLISY